MPTDNAFFKPLRFIWNHSRLLGPARSITEEAEDWTDAACAAGYLVLLFFLIYGLAISLSVSFMVGLAGFAVAVILVRVAIRYFSRQ